MLATNTEQESVPTSLKYELYDNFSDDRSGDLVSGAILALKHKLYVPSADYCLYEELIDIRENGEPEPNIYRIVLAKDLDTDKYVCCIFLMHHHLQSFTRKAYRKRGIAKAAIARLGKLSESVYAMGGARGSYEFWEKVGVNAY